MRAIVFTEHDDVQFAPDSAGQSNVDEALKSLLWVYLFLSNMIENLYGRQHEKKVNGL